MGLVKGDLAVAVEKPFGKDPINPGLISQERYQCGAGCPSHPINPFWQFLYYQYGLYSNSYYGFLTVGICSLFIFVAQLNHYKQQMRNCQMSLSYLFSVKAVLGVAIVSFQRNSLGLPLLQYKAFLAKRTGETVSKASVLR